MRAILFSIHSAAAVRQSLLLSVSTGAGLTYKKAPKARRVAEEQMPLAGTEVEDEGPF